MKAVSLMYHDIVAADQPDASGFPGADAARYKLSPEAFTAHLDAIARRVPEGPALVTDPAGPESVPLLITFDDGGAGALAHAATLLERQGWRGHFLVTAGSVGSEGFLDGDGIRELAARGHIVGSHSVSHPMRMSALGPGDLLREWRDSVAMLERMAGGRIDVASIPGGYYSRDVARAAAAAGIRYLFTSEPTRRVWTVDGCTVLGRFTVQRGTSPSVAAALAAGAPLPRLAQMCLWNAKKAAKVVGGSLYLTVRGKLLRGG